MTESREEYEVVVVGGGPAGLSSALMLGRCMRKTLVCDSGRYRNQASRAIHGYLSRDGVAPDEFLDTARRQLEPYHTVKLWRGEVTDVAPDASGGFLVERQRADPVRARKLVLATGVIDELPSIEGAPELLGRGVHVCPYCDAWELRGERLAVYGRDDAEGAGLARMLTHWSRDVVLCTDGSATLDAEALTRLKHCRVRIEERPILRLEPDGDRLARVIFRGGAALDRRAFFFNTSRHQATDFAARLGCTGSDVKGCRVESRAGRTNVPGLFVVGDASRDVLQVVVAAAEGAEAAIEIHCELAKEAGVMAE